MLKTCIFKIIMYICKRNDKVINQNQIYYEPKKSNWRQGCKSIEVGCMVCNDNCSIYNW